MLFIIHFYIYSLFIHYVDRRQTWKYNRILEKKNPTNSIKSKYDWRHHYTRESSSLKPFKNRSKTSWLTQWIRFELPWISLGEINSADSTCMSQLFEISSTTCPVTSSQTNSRRIIQLFRYVVTEWKEHVCKWGTQEVQQQAAARTPIRCSTTWTWSCIVIP